MNPDQLKLGELIPAVCVPRDVARVLGLSCSRIYALQRTGKLRRFELDRVLGDERPRYSGKKIQAWLDGTLDAPRFFGSARKRTA